MISSQSVLDNRGVQTRDHEMSKMKTSTATRSAFSSTSSSSTSFSSTSSSLSRSGASTCKCPTSCCPDSREEDDLGCLLKICFAQWGVMAILATLIVARLTYLQVIFTLIITITIIIFHLQDMEWIWFVAYSGLLLLFSLPLLVCTVLLM